jgi:hypothetical protein
MLFALHTGFQSRILGSPHPATPQSDIKRLFQDRQCVPNAVEVVHVLQMDVQCSKFWNLSIKFIWRPTGQAMSLHLTFLK